MIVRVLALVLLAVVVVAGDAAAGVDVVADVHAKAVVEALVSCLASARTVVVVEVAHSCCCRCS